MAVFMPAGLQQTILTQMEATFPNEGGGFLIGEQREADVYVYEVIAVDNVFPTEEQYHRYAMTPQNWSEMEDRADALGFSLIGYYHSHPNSPAIPSEFDRVHALPNFTYLITSVIDGRAAEQRVWFLKADRSAFDEATLHIEPSG
ncbi:M67 family metallopeptidase [Aggregatilineales bacterium SYSU G02658]